VALGILQPQNIRDHARRNLAAVHLQSKQSKLAYARSARLCATVITLTDVDESANLLDPRLPRNPARRLLCEPCTKLWAGAPKQGGTVLLNWGDASRHDGRFIQSELLRVRPLVWLCRARAYRCRTKTGLASQRKKGPSKFRSRRGKRPSTDYSGLCDEERRTADGLGMMAAQFRRKGICNIAAHAA